MLAGHDEVHLRHVRGGRYERAQALALEVRAVDDADGQSEWALAAQAIIDAG